LRPAFEAASLPKIASPKPKDFPERSKPAAFTSGNEGVRGPS
jgi:hypothetical protein